MYLSFDIATRTLAYCLYDNNIDNIILNDNYYNNIIEFKYGIVDLLEQINISSIVNINSIININKLKDGDLSTTQRIKLLTNYINTNIKPIILQYKNLTILLEFQLASNQKARMILHSMIALFYNIDSNIKIVIMNPSLKNQIYLSERGKYYNFVEKYNNSYKANKEHTKYNFNLFINKFNININKKEIGHIADAFFQLIAYKHNIYKKRLEFMY